MEKYHGELPIDHLNMIDECNMQPQLYGKWADLWAYAVEEKDELKRKLDFEEADLQLKYRRGDLDTEGIKITEDALKKLVTVHPSYQTLLEKYNEACKVVNLLNNAKTAFDQRKKMIETVSYMLRMEYHSNSSIGLTEEDAQNYVKNKGTAKKLESIKKKKRRVKDA